MTTPSESRDFPERMVLEGVPRVGFFPDVRGKPDAASGPEDFPWPSCLRACMRFLGEEHSYAYLIGTTGAGFFLNWQPGWHHSNSATYFMSSDAAASFVRGFDAVGYDYDITCGDDFRNHPDAMRRRIIESINAGRPAMSHGVIGPPETAIITGYDEGGDVLIGWSFFQTVLADDANVTFEPSGYFRKRNWFADTWDLLLIGEKHEPPAPKAVLRSALEWALEVARTPVTWGNQHNGLAAYDAWAEHVLRDNDIASGEGLPDSPFEVHSDAVGVVAEGRWYASRFLAEMTGHDPKMASDLLAAASCHAAEHDLMWKIWGCVGGLGRGEAERTKFADAAVRRKIAGIIRQSRDLDAQAADHIERALSR